MGWTADLLWAAVVGALATMCGLLVWATVPMVFGWHPTVDLSGSMAPQMNAGDVVMIAPGRPARIRPGQVIQFAAPGERGVLRLHRVVRRNQDGTLVTRGDANRVDDSTPVRVEAVKGLARLRVPFVGLATYWLRTGQYLKFSVLGLVVIGALVVAGVGAPTRGPPPPGGGPEGGGPEGGGPVSGRGWRRGRRGRRLGATAGAIVVLGALSAPPAAAAFRASLTNGTNTFGAASSFPTYAQAVVADAPLFYLRQGDAVSASASSSAADSSGHNLPGTFNGPTNGPVAWWKFNEGSGSSTTDSSGNVDPATLAGTAGWTGSGHEGSAFSVSSGSGWADAPEALADTTRSFTVSAWVYATAGGQARCILSQLPGGSGHYSGFILKYDYNGGVPRWAFMVASNGSGGYGQANSNSASLNTWTQVTGVFDALSSTATVYVNGSFADSTTFAGTSSTTGVTEVGRDMYNGALTDPWAGRIDDARVYKRALSSTEVSNLYNSGGQTAAASMTNVMSAGATPGALQGAQQGQQSATAVAFQGTVGGYQGVSYSNPSAFTVECWFRASGSAGGEVVGFASNQTGTTGSAMDRIVYLDASGKVVFGVNPGSITTIASAAGYADGAWHHVAAGLGAAGMQLFVDGSLVASNGAVTTAQNFTGYWRWGGSFGLSSWPNPPTSSAFVGEIQEFAVYGSQLSASQVSVHYHANH